MSRKTPISPFRETIFTIQNQSRELNDIPIYNPDYSVLSTNAQPSYQYPRPVPPPISRPINTTPKKSTHSIPVSHTPIKQPISQKKNDHSSNLTPKKQPQPTPKKLEPSHTPTLSQTPTRFPPSRQSFAPSTPQTKPFTPKQPQQPQPTSKLMKSPIVSIAHNKQDQKQSKTKKQEHQANLDDTPHPFFLEGFQVQQPEQQSQTQVDCLDIVETCQETSNSEFDPSEELNADAVFVASLVIQALVFNALEQANAFSKEIVQPEATQPSQEDVSGQFVEHIGVLDGAATTTAVDHPADIEVAHSQEVNLDATVVASIIVQAVIFNAITQTEKEETSVEQDDELVPELESGVKQQSELELEQSELELEQSELELEQSELELEHSELELEHSELELEQSELELEQHEEELKFEESELEQHEEEELELEQEEQKQELESSEIFEEQNSFECDEFSAFGEDGEGEIVYEYIFEGEEGDELLEVQPE